jgi:DNA polymerase I-like protein with 3'-5' exonuclease and polymerase domains/uracil-DNA glycosylase
MSKPKIKLDSLGDPKSKVVIVSGWPLPEDGRKGQLWGGNCGKILRKQLQNVGIAPSTCYMTSVFKTPVYNENYNAFFQKGQAKYKFTEQGAIALEEFEKELQTLDPNIYILMGNLPLFYMTGNWGADRYRGSILRTNYNNRKALVTIPVMSTVKEFKLRNLLALDIKKAKKSLKNGARIIRDKRDLIVLPTLEESLDFLEMCKKSSRVGADIEIDAGEVSCISFSYCIPGTDNPSNKAISIPFWDYENKQCYFSNKEELEIWQSITELLEDPKIEIIYHNASFDANFLASKYGIVTTNIHDTMVAQGILLPEYKKGLGFCTTFYTDMPYYKDEGKEVILASGKKISVKVSNKEFYGYNAKDSVILPEILQKQIEELKRWDNYETYLRQRDVLYPTFFMHARGIKVSVEAREKAKEETEKLIEEVTDKIRKVVGYDINIDSPNQLKKYFYEELKLRVRKNRKTGKPSVDAKALKSIHKEGNVVAKLILEVRKYKKLSSTYYGMELDEDNRIRCSFNVVGTKSGRLSSSKTIFGLGGNMQNLPKSMKEFIIPDNNYIGYEIDLSQAENRIVALLANEYQLLDAFEKGEDIHTLTAYLFFGGEPTREYQENTISPLGNGTRSQRYWGKQGNHSCNYGLGGNSAAVQWDMPVKQAKELVNKYHSIYPAIRSWHRINEEQLKHNRTLTNLYGRSRVFLGKLYDNPNIYLEAHSFVPQSTVADKINKEGLLYIYKDPDLSQKVEILNQIHDSIMFQISKEYSPEEHIEILSKIVKSLESPITYRNRSMVLPCDVTVYPKNFKDGYEIDLNNVKTLKELF